MIKELKYLFLFFFIFFFLFFTLRYYFSDQHQKKSYRSLSKIEKNMKILQKNIVILENDTDNIIEYVEYKKNNNMRKYSFWKLLYND